MTVETNAAFIARMRLVLKTGENPPGRCTDFGDEGDSLEEALDRLAETEELAAHMRNYRVLQTRRHQKLESRIATIEKELFALDERTMQAEDAKDIYDDVRETVARLVIGGPCEPRTDSAPLDAEQSAIVAEAIASPPKAGPALRALLADEVATDIGARDEADYSWIKVKRYVDDPTKTWEERHRELEKHHEAETKFLINEVMKRQMRDEDLIPAFGVRMCPAPDCEKLNGHEDACGPRIETATHVSWKAMADAAIEALENAGPLSGDDYFVDAGSWQRYEDARKVWREASGFVPGPASDSDPTPTTGWAVMVGDAYLETLHWGTLNDKRGAHVFAEQAQAERYAELWRDDKEYEARGVRVVEWSAETGTDK